MSVTHTFGSDQGFEATHEAMLKYLTVQVGHSNQTLARAYHTSWNLNDMTMLLNTLEFVISNGHLASELRSAGLDVSAQQAQDTLDWAERLYREIASDVGVELI